MAPRSPAARPIRPFLALTPARRQNTGSRTRRAPRRRPLCVVVPVYRGLQETQACLNALFDAVARRTKSSWWTMRHRSRRWPRGSTSWRRHGGLFCAGTPGIWAFPPRQMPASKLPATRDVLLLNSDTLIPPGAIATLRQVAYAQRRYRQRHALFQRGHDPQLPAAPRAATRRLISPRRSG